MEHRSKKNKETIWKYSYYFSDLLNRFNNHPFNLSTHYMPIDATSFLTRNKIIAFEKIFSNFQPITNSQRASRPPEKGVQDALYPYDKALNAKPLFAATHLAQEALKALQHLRTFFRHIVLLVRRLREVVQLRLGTIARFDAGCPRHHFGSLAG